MQTDTVAFVGRALLALLGFNAIFSVQIFTQTTAVPLPPSVEKRPASKTDHRGLPRVPQFRDVAAAVGRTATHSSSSGAAIGARVTVPTGSVQQMAEVCGGSSYLSQNDLRLHFD